MTSLVKLTTAQSQKEKTISNNFSVLEQGGVFGNNPATTTGLVFGYYGGWFQQSSGNIVFINDGTVLLSANATNYIQYNPNSNIISSNTSGFDTGYVPLYQLTTNTTKITSNIPSGNKRSVFYAMHNTSLAPTDEDTSFLSERTAAHSGLNWGYYGGNIYSETGLLITMPNGTTTIVNSPNNYITYTNNVGSISSYTTDYAVGSIRMAEVSATGGVITGTIDKRTKQYQAYGVSPILSLKQNGNNEIFFSILPSSYNINEKVVYPTFNGACFNGPMFHSSQNGVVLKLTPGLFDGRTAKNSTAISSHFPVTATTGYYYLSKTAPSNYLSNLNTTLPYTTDDVTLLYKTTSTFVTSSYRVDTITDYRKVFQLRRYMGRYYEGSEATITADTTFTKTHGLILASGIKEIEWEILLYCKTAELGYAIGDEVKFMTGPAVLTAADPARHTSYINSTTMGLRVCEAIYVQHGTASTFNAITLANWGFRFRARITQ